MNTSTHIRTAGPEDIDAIHSMVCELAESERMSDQVIATAESTQAALFGADRCAEALVAEQGTDKVAVAIYFQNYSTFVGRPGLYLEDVYVRPAYRGQGIGKALLVELARIAEQRGCGRFEWCVLDWNTDAIDFYEQLGATVLPDWRIVRLDQRGIQALAR